MRTQQAFLKDLRRWARELGVEALLERVWAGAARVQPGDPSGA